MYETSKILQVRDDLHKRLHRAPAVAEIAVQLMTQPGWSSRPLMDVMIQVRAALLTDPRPAVQEAAKVLQAALPEPADVFVAALSIAVRAAHDIHLNVDYVLDTTKALFEATQPVEECGDSRSEHNRGPYCTLPIGHKGSHNW